MTDERRASDLEASAIRPEPAAERRDPPELCGLVVHWHNEAQLARLFEHWPEDTRWELVIVDNGSSGSLPPGPGRTLDPGANLGFGGAVNYALTTVTAPVVLLLNPDAWPASPRSLPALLEGLERHPDAAGVAPRLLARDGSCQSAWQLRRLPTAGDLLRQCLFVPWGGDAREPQAGSPVEQPAASALALRRRDLERLGGMDPSFYPAWFGDVDLARRMRDAGRELVYWPESEFLHELGASVGPLGYGSFLWIYYRNLDRYARKHFGAWLAGLLRAVLTAAAAGRIMLVPLKKPSRAPDRAEAVRGLASVLVGAVSSWRLPADLVRSHAPPAAPGPASR